MSELRGIIAPFTTPFTESGAVDLSLVPAQVEWLIENGVHGLAAGGSTGEGHVLNREEYYDLIEKTAEAIGDRVPLVAGEVVGNQLPSRYATKVWASGEYDDHVVVNRQ